MKKISKAKNSFVAHAIVVAVSLFLVAFSLSAPGVAFAEDVEVQSNEPTQTLIDQPAVVAEATPAVKLLLFRAIPLKFRVLKLSPEILVLKNLKAHLPRSIMIKTRMWKTLPAILRHRAILMQPSFPQCR